MISSSEYLIPPEEISTAFDLISDIIKKCTNSGVYFYSSEGNPLPETQWRILKAIFESFDKGAFSFKTKSEFMSSDYENTFQCENFDKSNKSKDIAEEFLKKFSSIIPKRNYVFDFPKNKDSFYVTIEQNGKKRNLNTLSEGQSALCWLLSSITWSIVSQKPVLIYFAEQSLDSDKKRAIIKNLVDMKIQERKICSLILFFNTDESPLSEAIISDGIEYCGSIREKIFYPAANKKDQTIQRIQLTQKLRTSKKLVLFIGRSLDPDLNGSYGGSFKYPLKQQIYEYCWNSNPETLILRDDFENDFKQDNNPTSILLEKLVKTIPGKNVYNYVLTSWRDKLKDSKPPNGLKQIKNLIEKGYGIVIVSTRIDELLEKSMKGNSICLNSETTSLSDLENEFNRIMCSNRQSPGLIINTCGNNREKNIESVNLLREHFNTEEYKILETIISKDYYRFCKSDNLNSSILPPPIMIFSGNIFEEIAFKTFFENRNLEDRNNAFLDYYLVAARPSEIEKRVLRAGGFKNTITLPLDIFLQQVVDGLDDPIEGKGPEDAYFPYQPSKDLASIISTEVTKIGPPNFKTFLENEIVRYFNLFFQKDSSTSKLIVRLRKNINVSVDHNLFHTTSYRCPEYVDHGKDHVITVLNNMVNLLSFCENPKEILLAEESLFLLIISTILHDIGMSGPPDKTSLPIPENLTRVQECKFVRKSHSIYSGEWIKEIGFSLSPKEKDIISTIIKYHSGEVDLEYIDETEIEVNTESEYKIPLKNLIFLLRFSDELDFYNRSGISAKKTKIDDMEKEMKKIIKNLNNIILEESGTSPLNKLFEDIKKKIKYESSSELENFIDSNKNKKVKKKEIQTIKTQLLDYIEYLSRKEHLIVHSKIKDVKIGSEGIFISHLSSLNSSDLEKLKKKLSSELSIVIEVLGENFKVKNVVNTDSVES